jgi:hypothetical protein
MPLLTAAEAVSAPTSLREWGGAQSATPLMNQAAFIRAHEPPKVFNEWCGRFCLTPLVGKGGVCKLPQSLALSSSHLRNRTRTQCWYSLRGSANGEYSFCKAPQVGHVPSYNLASTSALRVRCIGSANVFASVHHWWSSRPVAACPSSLISRRLLFQAVRLQQGGHKIPGGVYEYIS